MGTLEAGIGVAVMAAAVVDMLLTILYSRIGQHGLSRFGAGIGSVFMARTMWWLLRHLAAVLGRGGRAFSPWRGRSRC